MRALRSTLPAATRLAARAPAVLAFAACASSPRATTVPTTTAEPAPAAAQQLTVLPSFATTRGGFVVRLGADTIAIESYSRIARTLRGDLLLRSPRLRGIRYLAELGDDGRVVRFEASSVQPDGQASPTIRIELTGDSVITRIPTGDSVRVVRRAVDGLAVPWLGNSWALAEQAIAYALSGGRDSATILQVGMGGGQPTPAFVRRRGERLVELEYFGDSIEVRLDSLGRVVSADGRRTTNKVIVERVESLDFTALASDFRAREVAGRGLGALSTRDTAAATVGSASLSIDYGRPSKRGRQIWGGVVPWGQVWRTGANEATHFTTSRDVVFGGVTIPAGTYTIWTIPTATGATLIVNRRTGEWGTQYDQASDLARIPAALEALSPPVEQFTIVIEPRGASAGVMRLMWDDRQIVVPFAIR